MPILRLRVCPFCATTHVVIDGWVICETAHAILAPDGREVRKIAPAVCAVLRVLLLRRGKVTSYDTIAAEVWTVNTEPNFYKEIVREYIRRINGLRIVKITHQHGRGWEIG